MTPTIDQLLRPSEASAYLRSRWGIRATVATLAKWRHLGSSARFRKIGRDVAYERRALDEFAQTRISSADFASTVEASAAAEPVAA